MVYQSMLLNISEKKTIRNLVYRYRNMCYIGQFRSNYDFKKYIIKYRININKSVSNILYTYIL